jgi:P27 family predicted phage terminase small subunit
MRPGPAPKPTVIKRLAGNPGKRPLNDKEPQPERRMPRCPGHLNDIAKKEWRRISKHLYRSGLLTLIDRAALAAYCQAYGRWAMAEAIVNKKGEIVKTTNGNIIQNPYLSVANRAMEQMLKIEVEFGMTPSSRSRIKVDISDDREKSLAELLFDEAIIDE